MAPLYGDENGTGAVAGVGTGVREAGSLHEEDGQADRSHDECYGEDGSIKKNTVDGESKTWTQPKYRCFKCNVQEGAHSEGLQTEEQWTEVLQL